MRTEAIAPIKLSFTSASASTVQCPARCEARFTTAFFPQRVHISTDMPLFLGMDQLLEHIVIDDSNGDTLPSKQNPCTWCNLHSLSPYVARLYPSFHRCTLSTDTPCRALRALRFPALGHPGFSSLFASPSWPSPSELFLAPMSQHACHSVFNCVLLRPISLLGVLIFVFFDDCLSLLRSGMIQRHCAMASQNLWCKGATPSWCDSSAATAWYG